MRVIPIEHAISGETRRASYEEVSKYLNENEIFSVADCSCRTAREVMGKGVVTLRKTCAFRWAMLQNIIFVPKEVGRLPVRKLLKLLKGQKKMG